jgi:hypothetical protein
MAKKRKLIPTVPFELIIKGHEGVTAYRERHGQADLTVALVTTLADCHKPDEIIAVSYRLGALAKLIREGEVGKWTIPVVNQEYQLVNESMFRAAARAPLFEARTVGDVSFDPETFIKIALAESEARDLPNVSVRKRLVPNTKRARKQVGVTDPNEVFHSFRHGFQDALRRATPDEELRDALADLSSGKSVSRTYGAKYMVERWGVQPLKEAVEKISYPGLDLWRVKPFGTVRRTRGTKKI